MIKTKIGLLYDYVILLILRKRIKIGDMNIYINGNVNSYYLNIIINKL